MISLPYGEGGMHMDIILPKAETNMGDFIKGFGYSEYLSALSNVTKKNDVVVAIPKFKAEYELSLKDALVSLGMEEAFTGAADFTKINEGGNIFISEVKHKTYIDVNEKGTEAAAVTSVEMKLTAILDPIEFIADRPFLYTIRDTETGSILFSGIFDTP
jgi:serpin B